MKKLFLTALLPTLLTLVLVMPVTTQDADVACAEGYRAFEHDLLWEDAPDPFCIPEVPQRIVMLWPFHVPALLRGDVPLVGIEERAYLTEEFPAWESAFEAMPEVGFPPNPEVLLSLEPDLIITAIWFVGENYDDLSNIAPVLAFDMPGTHLWKEVAEMIFDAAGKLDYYAPLVAEYDARVAELGVLIEDSESIALSLVNVRTSALYLYTDYSPGGMIVADVGFQRPESQLLPVPIDEFFANEEAYIEQNYWSYLFQVSIEEIQQADGDFIIVFGGFSDDETQSALDSLTEHPLWQTLEAVKAGNIYVSSQNWAAGDIAGAHAILDEIARAFGVYGQLSPNPYSVPPEAAPEITPESAN